MTKRGQKRSKNQKRRDAQFLRWRNKRDAVTATLVSQGWSFRAVARMVPPRPSL
jgi:hypothetical protein